MLVSSLGFGSVLRGTEPEGESKHELRWKRRFCAGSPPSVWKYCQMLENLRLARKGPDFSDTRNILCSPPNPLNSLAAFRGQCPPLPSKYRPRRFPDQSPLPARSSWCHPPTHSLQYDLTVVLLFLHPHHQLPPPVRSRPFLLQQGVVPPPTHLFSSPLHPQNQARQQRILLIHLLPILYDF